MNNNNIKRIGIDARFYGPIGKGLGRYTQEIVDNITRLDRLNQYVIFLRKENFENFKTDNIRIKKVLADISWYSLAEQLIFPFLIRRERLDLMHFPHFNVPLFCPTKFVVTIHDLILIKFPTNRATTLGPFLYKIKNLCYKIVITNAVRRAEKVLAVSEFTKNDIIKHFKINPDKIAVTYEGVANLSSSTHCAIIAESKKDEVMNHNIKKPYLLYVGNAYPHKNLERLIKVFCEIVKETKSPIGDLVSYPLTTNLQLVLVGKEDYFYSRLKSYAKKIKAEVIFPGYVPDNELNILYKNALAYVFPSFYEGFGLPPLEAMANGCAVASSNQTSLPEILSEAALYFNPNDEQEMKSRIEEIISDKELRRKLISRGYEQIKKYSWQKCAVKILEIYEKIINAK